MSTPQGCIAYIDGANLHRGVTSLGWKLDYKKFRSWIRQKFNVGEAYVFIGMLSKHADLYTFLQSAGYTLVFKQVVFDSDGKAKGNCDADLVLRAVRDVYEKKPVSVILVSSDGDYAPLVAFWKEQGITCTIVSPAPVEKCSILLKRTGAPIVYLRDVQTKIEYH
jgi:uncharacterized LabA/DUF88 family protein